MIDLENVKKKILATVDKAGYITEKMLIDYCIEDNIPDYAIDQLCDQLFDAHVPVLDIPIFIENKYLASYSKHLTENTYSKKKKCLHRSLSAWHVLAKVCLRNMRKKIVGQRFEQ